MPWLFDKDIRWSTEIKYDRNPSNNKSRQTDYAYLWWLYGYQRFHSFNTTGLSLYSRKTLENQRFSDVFRGYRKRPVSLNRLMKLNHTYSHIWLIVCLLYFERSGLIELLICVFLAVFLFKCNILSSFKWW